MTAGEMWRSQADSGQGYDYGILNTTLPKFFPSPSKRYASAACSIGNTCPITGCKCPCEIHVESCFQASCINSRFAER